MTTILWRSIGEKFIEIVCLMHILCLIIYWSILWISFISIPPSPIIMINTSLWIKYLFVGCTSIHLYWWFNGIFYKILSICKIEFSHVYSSLDESTSHCTQKCIYRTCNILERLYYLYVLSKRKHTDKNYLYFDIII